MENPNYVAERLRIEAQERRQQQEMLEKAAQVEQQNQMQAQLIEAGTDLLGKLIARLSARPQSPPQASTSQEYYKYGVSNSCNDTVEVVVKYSDDSGNWQSTTATFSPFELRRILLRTKSQYVWFSAKSRDGNMKWEESITNMGSEVKDFYDRIDCNR
jgi:hypothetical protein